MNSTGLSSGSCGRLKRRGTNFVCAFNQAIEDKILPGLLQELRFKHRLNPPIEEIVCPDSLKKLLVCFGRDYYMPIDTS